MKRSFLGDGRADESLMAFPQAKEQAKGRRPHLVHGKMELAGAVIRQPGRQLLGACPAGAFFELFWLSIFLFVPLRGASAIAAFQPARSKETPHIRIWKSSNIGRWGQTKGPLNSLAKASPMRELLFKVVDEFPKQEKKFKEIKDLLAEWR